MFLNRNRYIIPLTPYESAQIGKAVKPGHKNRYIFAAGAVLVVVLILALSLA